MTSGSVGARARLLGDMLAALFEYDRELAGQLNTAQRRLLDANEHGETGLATIHRAFADYQTVAEQRRTLGADVGEAAARLIDAMHQDGYTEQQARQADVWALRDGIYRPATSTSGSPVAGLDSIRTRSWP
jgi:hypothetical protein